MEDRRREAHKERNFADDARKARDEIVQEAICVQDASPSSHAGRKHATELTSARTVLGLVWSSVAPNGLQLEQQVSPQVAVVERSQPRGLYSSKGGCTQACVRKACGTHTHTHPHTHNERMHKLHTQPN